MTDAAHHVDVYWSLQSPYCYLVLPRLEELDARADVRVTVKPVRPGVVRIPDLFKGRSDMARVYFDDDVKRTAEFLGMPIGRPNPAPVTFKPGSWRAEVNEDLVARAYGLFIAAAEAGNGVVFLSRLMRRIWDGSTTGWDQSMAEDLADLAGGPDPNWLSKVEANEAAMYAAGHWGVPLMVYRDEALYGQDRWDQLLWRIDQNA
ncbi:MAG: DsbA family protein [Pseudomonadota bacterium]